MWVQLLGLSGLLAVGMAARTRIKVADRLSRSAPLEPSSPDTEPLAPQQDPISEDIEPLVPEQDPIFEIDDDVARELHAQHLKHSRALVAAPVNNDEVYLLSERDGFAVWNRQRTSVSITASPSMLISYKGDREGVEARKWDFDVEGKDAGENTLKDEANEQIQWSVRYRNTKVGKAGFGSNFYEKFAILPQGKTKKWDSLYTVKLISRGFHGSLEWSITKGYCKRRLAGASNSCNEEASLTPLLYVHCSPIKWIEPNMTTPGAVRHGFVKEVLAVAALTRTPYYEPGTPFICSVAKTSLRHMRKMIRRGLSDMVEEYEPSIWLEMVHGQLELEKTRHASSFEVGLLSVVATAIKPAYDLGLHR